MPYLAINIGKPVGREKKQALQLEIGNCMTIIPGKTIDNTIINITDDCTIYKSGQQVEAVHVDVRLYKESPEESKREFSEKLFQIFEDVIGIPSKNVAINFIELPNWASGGSYK